MRSLPAKTFATIQRRHRQLHREFSPANSTTHAANHIKWQRRRVVVTGLGAITPIGPNMPSTWDAVLDTNNSNNIGITSLRDALAQQHLSQDQYQREWELVQSLSCQVAASVKSEWISNHPSADNLQINDGRTSRFVQLALIAADEAILHSGLDEWLGRHLNSSNSTTNELYQARRQSFGVSVGNGMSSTRDISMATNILSDNSNRSKAHRKITPHFVPKILPNSPSARIAIHNQLHGPNLSHSEACAAGGCAIAHGVELIQSGKVQGMVVGGCESAVEALGLIGFSRLRALSGGESSSRPFDACRDGFVLSEGAAMLVLEEHGHAVSRGADILAEVVGVGYSGDGFHITAPEPDGVGAARAMLNALQDAANYDGECWEMNCSMQDVDYVNAHATSTPVGDVAEIRAIGLALSQSNDTLNSTKPLLVSSTKGAMGHLLGGSGAIEAATTVLTVANQFVPHTHNLNNISEDIIQAISEGCPVHDEATIQSKKPIHLVQHEPIDTHVQLAMSNSFGFGGTNVSLLFAKYK